MVVNIISFAELLKTRGERGVGGDAIKKPNVHAVWTDPTSNQATFPPTKDSWRSGPDQVADGDSGYQHSCGFQELDPTHPPDPTRNTAESATRTFDDAGVIQMHGGIAALESTAQAEFRIDPFDSLDWRQKAAEYHAHHFSCTTCIAAGLMSDRGTRCRHGTLLWEVYQPGGASALNKLSATTVEVIA